MDESDKGPLGFQPTPLTGEQGRMRSPAQIFNAHKDANLSMSGGVKALRGSGERKTGNCDRFFGEGNRRSEPARTLPAVPVSRCDRFSLFYCISKQLGDN